MGAESAISSDGKDTLFEEFNRNEAKKANRHDIAEMKFAAMHTLHHKNQKDARKARIPLDRDVFRSDR